MPTPSLGMVLLNPYIDSKKGLFVCMNKFSSFCKLTPILLGEKELSTKQVASLFFDTIVRLLRLLSSVLYDRDVCFTEKFW